MKLTIDRSKWLRGKDADEGCNSYLLRACDSKQCCVGIYLSALGFTDDELRDKGDDGDCLVEAPSDDEDTLDEFGESWAVQLEKDPRVPEWLATESDVYSINDDGKLAEDERERQIAERFRRGGVQVTFVDGASQ